MLWDDKTKNKSSKTNSQICKDNLVLKKMFFLDKSIFNLPVFLFFFSRSSRSKKKENRKLLDTRKGSQYEDIAIIRELYNISHQAFEDGQAVRKTLLLAIRLGLPSELPIVVQDALKTLQASITRNLFLIWPPDFNNLEEQKLKAINLNYIHLSKFEVVLGVNFREKKTCWF